MQGLRDDLKEHVVLQRPDSFLAAANAARLKDSLRKHTSSATEASLSSLLSQLNTTANRNLQSKTPDDQPVSRQEFRDFQNELKRMQNSNNFSRNYQQRNNRTRDGRPICM